jgi:Protein of unknown function (DUF1036)
MGQNMRTFTALALSYTLFQSLTLLLDSSQVALAGTPASDCVKFHLSPYMTDHFNRIIQTSLSEQLAASVCQGVTTEQEATSIRECTSGLLFDRDSFGRVTQTKISEDTVLSTCAIRRPSPVEPRQSLRGSSVYARNNCRYPIQIALHYRKLSGNWMTEGWWNIDGNTGSYLSDGNGRIGSNNDIMYAYAKTQAGHRGYVWEGDKYFTLKSQSLPMKQRTLSHDKDGDYIVSFDCD